MTPTELTELDRMLAEVSDLQAAQIDLVDCVAGVRCA